MLIALVLSLLAAFLIRYTQSSDYFVNYRRAQLGAESCVEEIRAGIRELRDTEIPDANGMSLRVRVLEEPAPTWQPLIAAEITASISGKHGKVAHYTITTHFQPDRAPSEQTP
jgi:hypothetical protein